MKVSDFSFDLPADLVAQFPPEQRGSSRLLVLNRRTGAIGGRRRCRRGRGATLAGAAGVRRA